MFDKNFYPTPDDLIGKLIRKFKYPLDYYGTILEPSAGKGDILKYVSNEIKYSRGRKPKLDAIELNKELQATLKGNKYNVIHDDFLTFNTFKSYDLIIMNPPFDKGVNHLLKALDIQNRGGEIACILNAETIKNPYSNDRDRLIRLLEEYDADIEYMEDTFINAERKTDVEIAVIYVNIPRNLKDNTLLDRMKNEYKDRSSKLNTDIISNDLMESAIQRYNFELETGINLIHNFNSIQDNVDVGDPILEISVKGDTINLINSYIEEVRYKYWKTLIDMDMFRQILTTNIISEFHDKLEELRDYDFTSYNISNIMVELRGNLRLGVEETIYKLFKDFTFKYSYDEYSSNIHLYDGWKTNKSYKINDKRVIVPYIDGFQDCGYFNPSWGVAGKLRDIEKALNYLDGGRTDNIDDIHEILDKAKVDDQSKKVEFKYFYADFYRKGTAHIIWKDQDLIKKLNVFGSRKEGNLPPSYGFKDYDDMTTEEKEVIDSFEGKEEYKNTMNQTDFFLYNGDEVLRLMEG